MAEEQYGFILLSDEKWWNRLCERCKSGKKTHAFVRRNLVGPVKTEKLLFYVKRPSMQIKGVADFIERLAGDAKELWEKYRDEACLNSYKEYSAFLKGRKKATFIRFTNFCELENPVSFEALKRLFGILKVPRGGKYINREIVNQLIT